MLLISTRKYMKNKYKIVDNYVIIYLERRNGDIFETLIDLEDFDKLLDFGYTWHAEFSNSTGDYYAQACQYLGLDENGKPKYKTIMLHRFITDTVDKDIYVDHRDHKTLNNRRYNLRITENNKNLKHRKGKNKNNKSGYRNVCKIKNKWVVQLIVNGKNTRLKSFDDVHEAGKYAKIKREELYGEYAGNS